MTVTYSDNAIKTFEKYYYRRDSNSEFLETTPKEVFDRVARYISKGVKDEETWYDRFYDMMNDGYFRPCTPCMMNAGVQEHPQTAACFVSGMSDDLISILDMDKEAAIIFASGSGIGANFGVLREKGALLSSGGQSSGPFAFMKKLASTGDAVKSGGRSRRAAIMAMFTDDHPDLLEFITFKNGNDQELLKSMNLSVAISDAFMQAVENDEMWELYGVVDGKIKSKHKAKDIYNKMVENSHKTGDPGIWFVDKANKGNGLIEQYGQIISTNPCGEQSLLPRNCCSLASINLAKLIKEDGTFDWDKFKELARYGTFFLDFMIDKSGYPTPEYERMAKATRPIGLGIMGLADLLCVLGIPYDSIEAYELGKTISLTLTQESIKASMDLAQEYESFPDFEENRKGMIELCLRFGADIGRTSLRNSNWTTIAPTGTISISADCSSGMEPLFGITYTKNLADSDEKWVFVNPHFDRMYRDESWFPEAVKKIEANHGSCYGVDIVPDEVQKVWRTAHDINWKDRIEIQSNLQKGISNAISSTINLPKSATVDDMRGIYTLAWKKGLKGITVYRDGALNYQPVQFDKCVEILGKKEFVRPRVLEGKSYQVNTGHGKAYFTVNVNPEDGKAIEIFNNGAKGGGVSSAMMEAVGRLVSLCLQSYVSPEAVAKSLLGISDGRIVWDRLLETDPKPGKINSIPDAVAQVLYRFYVNGQISEDLKNGLMCPECGGPARLSEGCLMCNNCGSKCG